MWVKPAPDRAVRDPRIKNRKRSLLPAEGKDVPDFDVFWLRRLRDGCVVKCDPPRKAQPASAGEQHPGELAAPETPQAADAAHHG